VTTKRREDIIRAIKESHQEDVDPVWITRSDGRRQRVANPLVREAGHYIPSHIEIVSLDELIGFWDHPDVEGHQIGEVIEVCKLVVTGHQFTPTENEYWMQQTYHDPQSYQAFKNNVGSILKNGYRFEDQLHYGGKNLCIPTITRESGCPRDGRHRAATAYVLGAKYIPVGVYSADRYFDDSHRSINEMIELVRQFFQTVEWREYKQSESYRILTVR